MTYVGPLVFVLAITMGKEAYDDYQRYLRDHEANSTRYLVLPPTSIEGSGGARGAAKSTPSSALKVGDLVLLEKNQRVPADMVLLCTSEEEGTCFIRTDQLDGETDWKLKVAVARTQGMGKEKVGAAEGSLYGQFPGVHAFHHDCNRAELTGQRIPRQRTSMHSTAS